MFSIFEYIGKIETTNLQSVNKNWYNKVIPKSWAKIEMVRMQNEMKKDLMVAES